MQKLLISILLAIFITACGPIFENTLLSAEAIEETPFTEILADCFISFHLSAWNDVDGDEVWNAEETPLEGVAFQISGNFASITSKYPCISNQEGQCTIRTWAPGECLEGSYTITAAGPESHRPTTPDSIALSLDSSDFSAEAAFGFEIK